MQKRGEEPRVRISARTGSQARVVVVSPAELFQLVTFWTGVYFELLRECIRKDEVADRNQERALWHRLDELRTAINDDENFLESLERGFAQGGNNARPLMTAEMTDNLRYTFVNGTDEQRRTAALIVIAKRLEPRNP